MSDDLRIGLDAYARGDYHAAAEAWVRAQRAAPADKVLKRYLDHLRAQAPDVVAAVESTVTAALQPPDELPPMLPYVMEDEPSAITNDPWGTKTAEVVRSEASGLSFVADASRRLPQRDTTEIAAKMREAAELDDFSRALTLSEQVLHVHPADADARRIHDRAREALTKMSVSALGSLDNVPRVLVTQDQIMWLDLDQRAGFVLAQVDGISSYNDIVSVTAMDELETLEILARLARTNVIGL